MSPKTETTRQLSSLDVQFLLDTDRNYGHVGSVAILDPSTAPGEFNVEALRALIMSRIHLVPPFTSRLERVPFDLDWPYWVPDEHFDIGYHVRESALPKPGSMEQLSDQVARIYSRRLDQSRPLWELYLVHGLKGGKVAMVSKIHHAAVDGMSGGEIMTILFDVTPEPREVDPPGDAVTHVPTTKEMVARAIRSAPKAPFRYADRLARLLPHVDVVPSVLGLPGTEQVSKTLSQVRKTVGLEDRATIVTRPRIQPPKGAYDGKLSPHRVFGLGSISLTDVKKIKDHFGVKVNDVIVTLVTTALREHMLKHDMLPDRPLIAQIPVSVRTGEEHGTFGNQISLMFVPIPTNKGDIVDQLLAAVDELGEAKARFKALPAKALRDVTQFIPPALHQRASRAMFGLVQLGISPPYNVVISNVPGPPIDIYSCGAHLEALYPLSIIIDGAGINVTIMSYKDSIDIGVTADRQQTPDVQKIVEGMQKATKQLLKYCK
jgi:WS/DGAT/MGAT family acyltransferase